MTELGRLLVLAVASGVDLHLCLLALATAAATGWTDPFPEGLEQLAVLPVLLVMGGLWVLELVLERHPVAGLAWDALQIVARPLAVVLLTLLVLPHASPWTVAWAAAAAAVVAGIVHLIRTGGAMGRAVLGGLPTSPTLVALGEDTVTLGLVALALDHPEVGAILAGIALMAGIPLATPLLRAGGFAVRLVWSYAWSLLTPRGLRGREGLPDWLRTAVSGASSEVGLTASEHRNPKGVPVGAYGPRGFRDFRGGWIVVVGGEPVLASKEAGRVRILGLEDLGDAPVRENPLFRIVDLTGAGEESPRIVTSRHGSPLEGLAGATGR